VSNQRVYLGPRKLYQSRLLLSVSPHPLVLRHLEKETSHLISEARSENAGKSRNAFCTLLSDVCSGMRCTKIEVGRGITTILPEPIVWGVRKCWNLLVGVQASGAFCIADHFFQFWLVWGLARKGRDYKVIAYERFGRFLCSLNDDFVRKRDAFGCGRDKKYRRGEGNVAPLVSTVRDAHARIRMEKTGRACPPCGDSCARAYMPLHQSGGKL